MYDKQVENKSPEFAVVKTTLKKESQEQSDIRRKKEEEELLKAQQKDKKVKAVEQSSSELLMIKVPIIGNIDMSYKYPLWSKWAASQLQIILDNDIDLNDNLFARIYPQKDKIPVISPTGK